jgi:hypothetical protein
MYDGNLGQNRFCNLLRVFCWHDIFFCLEYVMMSLLNVCSTLLLLLNVLWTCSFCTRIGVPKSCYFWKAVVYIRSTRVCRDGFGSDMHGYEFGCHYLPTFYFEFGGEYYRI